MPKQPPHHELPIVPKPEARSLRLDSARTAQQPPAAERVWALHDARQVIFSELRGRHGITVLLLSKATFSEAVKALYRGIRDCDLQCLQQAVISFVRYAEYVDAVRILHVKLTPPPVIPACWLKPYLCVLPNLRRVTWGWGRSSEGQIDLFRTGTSGIPSIAVLEKQAAVLRYTLGDGEPRMLGMSLPLDTEMPLQWQVTQRNEISARQLRWSSDVPLLQTWNTYVADSPDVICIPWVIDAEELIDCLLSRLAPRQLPRKLQVPIAAYCADEMLYTLKNLPPALAELEIGRVNTIDSAESYPPSGGLGFYEFLQADEDFYEIGSLQSLTIPLYPEILSSCTRHTFTSCDQLADFLRTLKPVPLGDFVLEIARGRLSSLRLSLVLPWNVAKALEDYRPGKQASEAVVDELARLLSPCDIAVEFILGLGRLDCDHQLDVLAPFGEKGNELLATRILSERLQTAFRAFRAERHLLEMQAIWLHGMMEGRCGPRIAREASLGGMGRGGSLLGAYSDTKGEVAQVRDIAESEDGASVDTDEEED